MIVIQNLRMDLARCGCAPIISAVQGEANTRTLMVSLYDNGIAWEIPEVAVVDVAFKKPDGTQGIYSRLPDGSPATTFDGNVLTATLAPQALTCAGKVAAAFIFHKDGEKTLATFPFTITVTANPATGAERSEDYYNPSIGDIEAEVKAVLIGVQAATDAAARAEANAAAAASAATTAASKAAAAATKAVQDVVDDLTAADVGARPDTWTPTAAEVGARPNTWTPTAAQVGARPNTWTPTAAQVGARPDTWTPTAAEVGAAPAGYGIGKLESHEVNTDNDIDSVLTSQINGMDGQTFKRIVLSLKAATNFTGGGGHYYADIYKLSTNFAMITIKSYIQFGRTMQRTWFEGALTPWEWNNPPMTPGVEYRTTKRHNGKPVYTKLVEFGALPNNAEKSVSAMPANASLIQAAGYAAGASYNVPIPGYYAIKSFGSTRSSGALWISTAADMSSYNAWITIEYTKD